MKKIFAILLAVCMLLTLSLCAAAEEATGVANPWTETTAEDLAEAMGFGFTVPEGAENVVYLMIEEDKLAEMDFDLDGMSYTARMQPAAEWTDISGMYYEWDNTMEDITIGSCEAWEGRAADGGNTVDLCLWFDVVPGMMYSLSTVSENDLDGFDITAVAEAMFTPLQHEN